MTSYTLGTFYAFRSKNIRDTLNGVFSCCMSLFHSKRWLISLRSKRRNSQDSSTTSWILSFTFSWSIEKVKQWSIKLIRRCHPFCKLSCSEFPWVKPFKTAEHITTDWPQGISPQKRNPNKSFIRKPWAYHRQIQLTWWNNRPFKTNLYL